MLVLTEPEAGIYQAGSYYEYLKSVVERSLNNFLADTTFPYTASGSGGRGGFGGFGELGGLPDLGGGFVDQNGNFQEDGINRIDNGQTETGGTYETAQDYIDSLNADGVWVIYDSAAHTASITSGVRPEFAGLHGAGQAGRSGTEKRL